MLRYREVKLALMEIINEMNSGDKIPSRTVLCKQFDSSRVTIDKVIKELEQEGFLESRFGSGTYVARRLEGVVTNVKNWCLIVPNINENIYAKLFHSVENAARERNANVILCNSENSAEKQSEYIRRLIMAGIDGFIIVPVVMRSVLESTILYQSLLQSKIPFVFCNRDVEGVPAPIVKSNDFYGSYMATLHLLDQGYQNIVYLAKQHYRTSVERCQGYISALQHRNQEIVRKRIIMLEDNTAEDCYKSLSALLKTETPVDAVFCFNDAIAIQAMRAVEDRDLRVSDDIGIIGYDDTENSADMKIPLTTVTYRTEEIGRMAAHVLDKMIEKNEKDTFGYYLIEPNIIVRESCLGKIKKEKEIGYEKI